MIFYKIGMMSHKIPTRGGKTTNTKPSKPHTWYEKVAKEEEDLQDIIRSKSTNAKKSKSPYFTNNPKTQNLFLAFLNYQKSKKLFFKNLMILRKYKFKTCFTKPITKPKKLSLLTSIPSQPSHN